MTCAVRGITYYVVAEGVEEAKINESKAFVNDAVLHIRAGAANKNIYTNIARDRAVDCRPLYS
jgi:hypothetical protein